MSLLDKASLIVTPNSYKESKLYSVIPNTTLGDMTVVRATTATRVNSAGLIESVAVNIPRIDYTNGSCPSLLVEPQRTNLALRSEEFDNAYWSKSASGGGTIAVTKNYLTSPSGVLDADRLLVNNLASFAMSNTVTVTNSTSYTMSIYAKSNTLSSYTYQLRDGYSSTLGTITITSNWQRFTLTFTSVGVSAELQLRTLIGGASDISVWGAQLEAGSYATSYIPTVASTVTRNADIISKTGISSLIGQTEGAVFVDVNLNSRVTQTYFAISSSATAVTDYIGISFRASTIVFEVVRAGTLQATHSLSNSSTGRFKLGIGYKANDFVFYSNGTQLSTDSSGTPPNCNDIVLFNSTYSQNQALNYNSVQLYKTRLTNSELAQLTTL